MSEYRLIKINKKYNVFRFEKNTLGGTLYILNTKSHSIFECTSTVYHILDFVNNKKYDSKLLNEISSIFEVNDYEDIIFLMEELKRKEIILW